jgi:hypothetical protein
MFPRFLISITIATCLAACLGVPGSGSVSSIEPSAAVSTSGKQDEPTAVPPTYTQTPTSTPDPSMTPTEAAPPTLTPYPTETQHPTETLTPTALPGHVQLGPINHQYQTLNNCHRASIAALMAYYDIWFSQDEYNLGMDNLAEFVSDYGLIARVFAVRYAVVLPSDAVRWLLAESVPVIAGQDLSREDNTWHYRVVYGYDDSTRRFSIADPLLGYISLTYDEFDTLARGEGQIIPVYLLEFDQTILATMKVWQMKQIEYPN